MTIAEIRLRLFLLNAREFVHVSWLRLWHGRRAVARARAIADQQMQPYYSAFRDVMIDMEILYHQILKARTEGRPIDDYVKQMRETLSRLKSIRSSEERRS